MNPRVPNLFFFYSENAKQFCFRCRVWVNELYLITRSLWFSLWLSDLWDGQVNVSASALGDSVCAADTGRWGSSPLDTGRWVCARAVGVGWAAQNNQVLLKALSSTNGLNANQSLPWWKPESSKFGIKLWQTGIWDEQTQFGHILLGFESH